MFKKLFLVSLLLITSEVSLFGESFQRINIREHVGEEVIKLNNHTLKKYDTPNKYYPSINFSFLAYMSYRAITSKNSSSYKITNSTFSYTDNYGYRRYKINNNQFSINNEDDYIIAIGNFYKQKGVCGERFLIVTDKSMYTVITGDEKNNNHTDKLHMFEKLGQKANVVEFLVDTKLLEKSVKKLGTVTGSKNEIINGKIQYIYKILN